MSFFVAWFILLLQKRWLIRSLRFFSFAPSAGSRRHPLAESEWSSLWALGSPGRPEWFHCSPGLTSPGPDACCCQSSPHSSSHPHLVGCPCTCGCTRQVVHLLLVLCHLWLSYQLWVPVWALDGATLSGHLSPCFTTLLSLPLSTFCLYPWYCLVWQEFNRLVQTSTTLSKWVGLGHILCFDGGRNTERISWIYIYWKQSYP